MDTVHQTGQLVKDDTFYRLIFENMLNGLAYCRMIFDDLGNPVDFIYLEVNPAFEKLTGLKNVIDKKVSEVIPDIKKSNAELFTIYGRVVTTGNPELFEVEVKQLSIWLLISVYRPEKECFVAVFENITKRKQAENELIQKINELEHFNKLTVDRELIMVELKERIKELEKK